MNQNDIDREHRAKEVADLALSFLQAFLLGQASILVGDTAIRLVRDPPVGEA